MSDRKKNPHADHRARVRARIRATGFDGMADHNVLEYLLFYSIARKDTNELAHRLIDEFGGLMQVLTAPYDRLIEMEGVGENTAMLLNSYALMIRRLPDSKPGNRCSLDTPEAVRDFLMRKYLGATREIFFMLSLNSDGELLNCTKLGEGGADSVNIDKREILQVVLKYHADSVILSHNHLNGILAPSIEDLQTTAEISRLLSPINVRLTDHVIVDRQETLSLASLEKFQYLFL